jgi:hypothetical protein
MTEIVEKDFSMDPDMMGSLSTFVTYMVRNSSLLPYWWSEERESYLRKASLEVDIISSVINSLTMRLFNMPLQVVPDNQLISSHNSVAKFYQAMVNNAWTKYGELFINDMLTFDKGCFFVVESTTSPSLPISPNDVPTGLKYIPSKQIMLNNNPTYPYIWLRMDGSNLYLHETRVIRLTQMPISLEDNVYTGLSFTSRAFNVGSMLNAAITYGLESLGTLESDNIIWATSTTSKAIQQAFKDAQIDSVNSNKSVKGQNVYLGLRDPSAKLGQLEMKRLPASFDYEKFTNVAIKLLAIAAGVDENDIIAVSNAGTTKTASLISDLKAKYKLESWFTKRLRQELEQKFLPPFLKLQVGEKSDNISETEGKARINLVRSDKLLAEFGALDDRTARQNAVKYGLITSTQYEEMELIDGRLPNGLPIFALFFDSNEMVQKMLNLDIDVMNIDLLQAEANTLKINERIKEVTTIAINTTSQNIFATARQALAALNWLLRQFIIVPIEGDPDEEEENEPAGQGDTEDEDTNDNLDPSKKKTGIVQKDFNMPKTKKGRQNRSALHSTVRNVWSKKSDKLTTSKEELKTTIDGYYDIDEELLDNFVSFVNQNRQDAGTKLSELYDLLDDLIENYDVS